MDYIARVSEVSEDGSTARVVPLTADGLVTRPFPVHWSLRYGESRVQPNEKVICLQFSDGSGIVLCRPDGSWTHVIGGSCEITDDLYVDGDSSTQNLTAAAQVSSGSLSTGPVSSGAITATSVTAGGVSLAGHVHDTADGTTSGPR